MSNSIYTQNISINSWFQNARNNLLNLEILVLNCINKDDVSSFKDELKFINIPNLLIKTFAELSKEDLNTRNNMNIILVESKNIGLASLEKFKGLDINLIFVPIFEYENIRNPISENFLNQRDSYFLQTCIPTPNMITPNLTPNLITPNMINYIEYVIDKFLNYNNTTTVHFHKNDINLALFDNKKEITLNTILQDIKYLQNESCLTSRLGMFIYKICTFHFTASATIIGKYYAKHFKNSKPLNNKKYAIVNLRGYKIPNFSTDRVMQTKRDIALNLMRVNDWDMLTLSQIVGLNINDLNALKYNA